MRASTAPDLAGPATSSEANNMKRFKEEFPGHSVGEFGIVYVPTVNGFKIPLNPNHLSNYRLLRSQLYSEDGLIQDATMDMFEICVNSNATVGLKRYNVEDDLLVPCYFAKLNEVIMDRRLDLSYSSTTADVMIAERLISLFSSIASMRDPWKLVVDRNRKVFASGIAAVPGRGNSKRRRELDDAATLATDVDITLSRPDRPNDPIVAVTIDATTYENNEISFYRRGSQLSRVIAALIGSGSIIALYLTKHQWKLFWISATQEATCIINTYPKGDSCEPFDKSFIKLAFILVRASASIHPNVKERKYKLVNDLIGGCVDYNLLGGKKSDKRGYTETKMYSSKNGNLSKMSRVVPSSQVEASVSHLCLNSQTICICDRLHSWELS